MAMRNKMDEVVLLVLDKALGSLTIPKITVKAKRLSSTASVVKVTASIDRLWDRYFINETSRLHYVISKAGRKALD